ncbi:MAG TPA: hypothetical protein VH418_00150 [Solirubrobacteraceae bacterium]|jgi:hypothetical protein
MKLLKTKKVLALAAVMMAATSGTALAVFYPSTGGAQLQMLNQTQDAITTTSSTTWVDLPGAHTSVYIPTGTQLINARFTSESQCEGPLPGSMCNVRIVAQQGAAAPVELNPPSGTDFAYDSVPYNGDDYKEAHAMERSKRLTEGTWNIRVQYRVSYAGTVNSQDDWHFAVETSR